MKRRYIRAKNKVCSRCGGKKTKISKTRKGNTYPHWLHDNCGRVVCSNCYDKQWFVDNPAYQIKYYQDNREYKLLYCKITQPRRTQLQHDRNNLRNGKWIV